jgi:LacI family transcriptional regulator
MKPSDSLLPKRASLVSECVRVMRKRIEAGEWTNHLPGERRLAELLNVGRDTIRLMLEEVTAEGLIAPGVAGKQRQLTGHRALVKRRAPAAWRIGMLSPFKLELLSQTMLAEVDQIRSLLAQRGGSLELFAPPWYEASAPGKRLTALLAAEPCDAWILYRSSRAIQEFFQSSRTPCVIRGYPHQGVELPFMDYDWQATGRHAVGELWRKGHRHIGIVMPRDGLRGNVAALQGAASFNEPGIKLTEIWEDGTTEGMVAALEPVLRQADAPGAFITLRPRQALTLLTWLGSRGLQVPKHFSLISLATEVLLASVVPRITTYHIDPSVFAKRVAKHLEQLLDGQIGTHGSLLMMPTWVAGGSIAIRG